MTLHHGEEPFKALSPIGSIIFHRVYIDSRWPRLAKLPMGMHGNLPLLPLHPRLQLVRQCRGHNERMNDIAKAAWLTGESAPVHCGTRSP